MRAVNRYAFLACACGLRIKVPPNFNKPTVPCPRCGREFKIPAAQLATITSIAAISTGESEKTKKADKKEVDQISTYTRKGQGWESFHCACGTLVQISPLFAMPSITCPGCERKTIIK